MTLHIAPRIDKVTYNLINKVIQGKNFDERLRFLVDYYLSQEKVLNSLKEVNSRYREVVNRLDTLERMIENKR